jgi:hypothetical protein
MLEQMVLLKLISPTASQRKKDLVSLEATQVMEATDGTFVYTGFKPAWVMIKSN